jgi:ATP-dependent RNA helicase DOB1
MYNIITEQKIKNIPQIGEVDIERLPQDLTRIYAQIVSLRRQIVDGTINFQEGELHSGLLLLRKLASNLETILLAFPNHEQKESIAFVAATANSLIHAMMLNNEGINDLLGIDSISPYLASVVLFLIANSQADASETALSLSESPNLNPIHHKLVKSIVALATGKLAKITDIHFEEEEMLDDEDYQEMALNFLWRELGLGIIEIGKKLSRQSDGNKQNNHFEKVLDLSVSKIGIFDQRNIFGGPFRLAKLLKILEDNIFDRAIIDIIPPTEVDLDSWRLFLEKLSHDRPYLWENHKEAVSTSFLNIGTSAVLTLPTGAGKSTLSELKIATCLYSGSKAIYLVPTHALEDQVNKNLRALFAEIEFDNLELDGEYTEIEELDSFPILVMTPERCLTLMNTNANFFHSVGLVVFDEFHLIHGTDIKKDRRSIDAMYCLLSLFSIIPNADYLLISAMVENGDEICNWISQITNRECLLFNSSWKPTRQLHGCLVFEQTEIERLIKQIRLQRLTRETKNPPSRLKKKMLIKPQCIYSLKNIWETVEDEDYFTTQILDSNILLDINNRWRLTANRNDVAAKLGVFFSKQDLKTLIFVDDPRIATSTAHKISEELNYTNNNFSPYCENNKYYIECIEKELGNIEHSYFYNCNNVGVHHGLLLPVERNLIEQYFKQPNGATAIVATATLAQGINLPAEIVIIAGDDRFDDDTGFRQRVNPYELLNAAGRAGRAGQSSQGAVILIPGEIVTVEGSSISNRWWQLKDEVFSKGDQCLKISDPLEYFLDSIEESGNSLDSTQINILYRFKPEKLSENDTKKLLRNSLYAYLAAKEGASEKFEAQVKTLLDRRNELDGLSEDINWTKEISYKAGVDPSIIFELGDAIDEENFDKFINSSISELIDWFFGWMGSNDTYLERIFIKPSILGQIKRTVGLKYNLDYTTNEILERINTLKVVLKKYIQGTPLDKINDLIPNSSRPDTSPYLIKSRNFVIRLIPELSFSFGLLSMVIIEKAIQKGIEKDSLPWNVRVLASCIREGFDSSEKLFLKKRNNLLMRVETHNKYNGI